MSSFYGGRPGNSFVIVTTYRSVADMIESFKKGPNYTAVHYDEYVMINPVDKSNEDNGKIYRRGYDYTNENGGAEYIGCIAGPSGAPGNPPDIIFTTAAGVEEAAQEAQATGEVETINYTITNDSLMPGYVPGITPINNNKIIWKKYVATNITGDRKTMYIGFKIPYPVFNFSATTKEPYKTDSQIYDENAATATKIDNPDNPFYNNWQLGIPKGIKGDSLNELRVQAASSLVDSYAGKTDDLDAIEDGKKRDILTYTTKNYDAHKSGDISSAKYLADYNVIDEVALINGDLIVKYTHKDNTVFPNVFKRIAAGRVEGLNWTGVGELIDEGTAGTFKTVQFTVPLTNPIDDDVASIAPTAGNLLAANQYNNININGLSINNTDITQTLFGLSFVVTTHIPSDETVSQEFINVSLSSLTLAFINGV